MFWIGLWLGSVSCFGLTIQFCSPQNAENGTLILDLEFPPGEHTPWSSTSSLSTSDSLRAQTDYENMNKLIVITIKNCFEPSWNFWTTVDKKFRLGYCESFRKTFSTSKLSVIELSFCLTSRYKRRKHGNNGVKRRSRNIFGNFKFR
jgi:hypothetical protein